MRNLLFYQGFFKNIRIIFFLILKHFSIIFTSFIMMQLNNKKKQWVRVKSRIKKVSYYTQSLKPATIALHKFQSAFYIECTFFV